MGTKSNAAEAQTASAISVPSLRSREIAVPMGSIVEFFPLFFELGMLAVLIKRFNLESPAFFQVALLAFSGFVVNYFLPLQFRKTFFLLLSLSSIVMVLGADQAAWLVSIGLILIGLCHLPLPLMARLSALIVVVAALAVMRAGQIPSSVPSAVWPLLGSMFLFRMMVYLYDLSHGQQATSISDSLSYFFMLPNVCFPLFPVVDFQAFSKKYYSGEPNEIYRVGVRWIFRGVLHLIVYRILYKNWGISLYEVENAGDLVHFCVWLFLLYLRVSGQFHVIVGMLHLYGFNLAETHHLYYLASNFVDLWRRINIYWKDFMMKVFFYPAYFRLKAVGAVFALVVSTLLVFAMTWLLHAVQWFWLRGKFLWAANDILFWAILAPLVVINSLWELKRGKKRAGNMGTVSWPGALAIGGKTLATFTVICALWSLWSSNESFRAWWTMWDYIRVPPTTQGWLLIATVIAAIGGGATIVARNPAGFSWNRLSFFSEAVISTVAMILLAGVSIDGINQHFGQPGAWISSAKTGDLNPIEMAELERGYYEDLMDVNRFNGELWTLYSRRPVEWSRDVVGAGVAEPVKSYLRFELKPSVHGRFKGAPFNTNHWGMHDDEYDLKPPAGCFRIALLGASHAMATGVDANSDFESLLEQRLNRENAGKQYSSYQILNFAVAGYAPTAQFWVLEQKVLSFEPNAIIYTGHVGDDKRALLHIVHNIRDGIDLPEPYLRELARRANVDSSTPEPVIRRRMAPFGDELLTWALRKIVEISKSHGIRPVFVLLPEVSLAKDPGPDLRRAEEAGFTVLNLFNVYDGADQKSLWVSEWDNHPNVKGHQLIADRLYNEIRSRRLIPIDTPPTGKQ